MSRKLGLFTYRLFILCLLSLALISPSSAQQVDRKLVSKVMPVYPDTLRKFNVNGVVKLEVIISPDGSVKDVRTLGGNPVLVELAVDAVRKWKYAPSDKETTSKVALTFMP